MTDVQQNINPGSGEGSGSGSAMTAIVAILVIVLIALAVYFGFFRGKATPSDVNVDINVPGLNGDESGSAQ